jgi:hypothetical protein
MNKVYALSLLGLSFLWVSWMSLKDVRQSDDVHERLNQENYRSYARAPGFEKRVLSTLPREAIEGIYVDIFINDVIQKALVASNALDEWPVGSVLVKDGFKNGKHVFTAALEKSADGWFWVQWNSDGLAQIAGTPEFCRSCHSKGDDMVRAFRFPQYDDRK